MKRLVVFLAVVVALGVWWVRQDPPHQRLFSYKDPRGKTVYTNVLAEVPEDQRAKALASDDIPPVNTADYDMYISLSTGQPTTWFGKLFGAKKKAPEENAKTLSKK